MKRLCLLAAAATLFAAPALAEDTITIGMTESQTGPLNVDSLGLVRGAEMWRDEVNAAGGIKAGGKSYKVKFVTYDDQSVGAASSSSTPGLSSRTKRISCSAPISSGLTAPATVISEQYGKIMLDAGGAEAKPFHARQQGLFMVITSADYYLGRCGSGAGVEKSARQDRGVYSTIRSRRRCCRRRRSKPRRPASISCWMNPMHRPPPISGRWSTRSFPRMPTPSSAAAIIRMARRSPARCTTRRRI